MTEPEAAMKNVLSQCQGPMTMIMSAAMMRRMEVATLSKVLGREPTALELWYYDDELYWRNLARWHQDRLTSYQRIRDLVWGSS